MFLFLSKLLPLFIYPLGLSCVLLILALIVLWRSRRWAAGLIGFALTLLLVGSNPWIAIHLMQSLEWQYRPTMEELPTAAAIVVLGGGIKPQIPPRPWLDFTDAGDRILHGIELYKRGKAPYLILSGGRVDWKGGGPPESSDMAIIAEGAGVPASAILQDPDSHNTYENAVKVRQILEQKGIQGSVLLVTSALHTPRSLLVFHRQNIDAIPAPTDFQITENELAELKDSPQGVILNLLPDTAKLLWLTQALKEYIGIVIYWLKGWI